MIKDKNIKSIENIQIYTICIIAFIIIIVFNLYFFQKINREKMNNIIKYKNEMEIQKDVLEKGMVLMFNNVYLQRSWIEEKLNKSFYDENNSRIQEKLKYDKNLDISSLDEENNKLSDYYGNIIIDGDFKNKDEKILNKIEIINDIFKFQHYLNENSFFELWSVFYSKDQYITIYPFQKANEIVKNKKELFDNINDSIEQLNNIDDEEVYKKGWETDIFLDNAKKGIMFSKNLPVKKENEILGIVTSNINVNEMNSYIKQYDSEIFEYVIDSSNNIVYKNGELIKDIDNFEDLLNKNYKINNIDNVINELDSVKYSKNYFFTVPLDSVNFKYINIIPNKKINQYMGIKVFNLLFFNIIILLILIFIITIYKRNIKELKEIEELKLKFLMNVSHDLKAPLSSIIGFTEMITKKFNKNIVPITKEKNDFNINKSVMRIQRNLCIIEEEGNRLKHMVNNLLDLSVIESGQIYLKKEYFSPIQLVEEASEKMSYFIEKKDLAYSVNYEIEDIKIMGDKEKILQVFVNLIYNSIKFTQKGNISCNIKRDKDNIIFSISDTGIGIDIKEQDKIFERFYYKEDKNKGSGLGLAICKNIVELHEGDIWVKSKKGKGSTFSFSIPIDCVHD